MALVWARPQPGSSSIQLRQQSKQGQSKTQENSIRCSEAQLKAECGVTPGLAVILVGSRKDSQSYAPRPHATLAACRGCFRVLATIAAGTTSSTFSSLLKLCFARFCHCCQRGVTFMNLLTRLSMTFLNMATSLLWCKQHHLNCWS